MKKNKDIDIEYTKVAERTKKIKGNLKKGELEKAKQKYTDMINEVNECKGTYKDAMVRELRLEKQEVDESIQRLKAIQKMIESATKSYQKVDTSYKKAKM